MKNRSLGLFAVIATAALASGCQKAPVTDGAAASSAATETASADGITPAAPVEADPPLENYFDAAPFNDEKQGSIWMEYWVAANTDLASKEREKLEALSPTYRDEEDAFKREEIKGSILPGVDANLAKFKGQKYIKVRWGKGSTIRANDVISINWSTPGQYDFATKSFAAIHPCPESYSDLETLDYHRGDRVYVSIVERRGSKVMCQLHVEDMALAKKIEVARAAEDLDLGGYMYLKATEFKRQENATDYYVTADLVKLSYEVYSKRTGELLGKVD